MDAIIIVLFAPYRWQEEKAGAIVLHNVVKNVKELAARGVKEIVLTGVNLGDFGKGPRWRFRAIPIRAGRKFFSLDKRTGKNGRH